MKTILIDDGFYHPLNIHLEPNEEIEWEGQPGWKFSIALIELGDNSSLPLTGVFSALSPGTVYILLSGVLVFSVSSNPILFVLSIIVSVLASFLWIFIWNYEEGTRNILLLKRNSYFSLGRGVR